jgi:hypothetical protein
LVSKNWIANKKDSIIYYDFQPNRQEKKDEEDLRASSLGSVTAVRVLARPVFVLLVLKHCR